MRRILRTKLVLFFGLIAILVAPLNAQAQTWQKVAPSASGGGGGGAAYTAWGTTTCATGYTAAYSGQAIYPMSTRVNEGTAVGSPICSATSLTLDTQWVNAAEAYWANGTEPDGTNYLQRTVIDCAMCVK